MKRRPVDRGAGSGAGYPGGGDPETPALFRRFAAATACLGAAGLFGLGLPACESKTDKEVAEQQDSADTFEGEILPDASDLVTGQDLNYPETDAEDWTLLT